jgi:hypothetical protein
MSGATDVKIHDIIVFDSMVLYAIEGYVTCCYITYVL